MINLLFLIIGFLLGVIGTIIFSVYYTSKKSPTEIKVDEERFNEMLRERKDN